MEGESAFIQEKIIKDNISIHFTVFLYTKFLSSTPGSCSVCDAGSYENVCVLV